MLGNNGRTRIWMYTAIIFACALVIVMLFRARFVQPITLRGAVTSKSSDARKQLPIAEVEITTGNSAVVAPVKSDSSGSFHIRLPREIRRGTHITLHFRHPDYQPYDYKGFVGDQLYIVQLTPKHAPTPASDVTATSVTNVKVRYSIKTGTSASVGSLVKAFEVTNMGNVPCNGPPCSPDGRWKAAINSAILDAGNGNELRNVRVSCIAGPCPFTHVDTGNFTNGAQTVTATARNWSDTTTFLMEAEVFHPMVSNVVHESFPTIFGPALNFTIPTGAEGLCVEADLNGQTIIFPLGPDLYLSWANCNERANSEQAEIFRCELKSGYRF